MRFKDLIAVGLGRTRLAMLYLERWIVSSLGLRKVFNRQLARAMRQVGLFDADYYREANSDVASAGATVGVGTS